MIDNIYHFDRRDSQEQESLDREHQRNPPNGHAGYEYMRQALTDAGYREYEVSPPSNADTFYQKAIRENGRKLYYINVYLWDFSRYSPDGNVGVQYRAMMYRDDDTDMEIRVSGKYNISEAEMLMREVYDKMGFVPDLLNND